MKILIIGSGGREHAIARRLSRDPAPHELHAAPGSPGIAQLASCHDVPLADIEALTALAVQLAPDLVVIGPEAPLVAGLADRLREHGLSAFGPSAAAAQLEGSKSWAKEIMAEAGVPTAGSVTVTDAADLQAGLDRVNPLLDVPFVVKADGLAAGKGVVVTSDAQEALAHGLAVLQEGGQVVLEEYLDGPEVSLFCVADGQRVLPLAPAQDFKRALDGDAGPNTGGMGAYSPLPWAPADLADEVVRRVAQPTIEAMARRGTPFIGILYCGLALTSRGLQVVEFNARFGDPETQVVLERLEGDFAGLLLAAARGELDTVAPLEWSADAAVAVVLAAGGYPAAVRSGDPILGIAEAEETGAIVLQAGTALVSEAMAEDAAPAADADAADIDAAAESAEAGREARVAEAPDTTSAVGGSAEPVLVSAGGRVLAVVGRGADLTAARDAAYAGLRRIELAASHFRSDIAARAAAGEAQGELA